MQLRTLAGVFAVIGATDVLLALFAMELWPVALAVAAGLFAGLLWRCAGPASVSGGVRCRRGPAKPQAENGDRPRRVDGCRSALQHDRSGGDRRQRYA
jgi:hypothetical protein